VYAITRRLRKPILVPEKAARLSHQSLSDWNLRSTPEFGRVAMAIGLVSGSVPVLVIETQMGAPATQIIMNEILSDELTRTDYRAGKARIRLPQKVVIRVGTAGGINCQGKPAIKIGDIVNATHSIGATGAALQYLLGLDFWRAGAVDRFRNRWTSLGPDFAITEEGHPKVECSEDVVEALDVAGQRLAGGAYLKAGNITKDSLYAELSPEMFQILCAAHNCRSTEMELSAIALAARQRGAHFGMLSAIVGVLPDSFVESERAKAIAEQRSLQVALEAGRILGSRE